jgi:hypothetical protein
MCIVTYISWKIRLFFSTNADLSRPETLFLVWHEFDCCHFLYWGVVFTSSVHAMSQMHLHAYLVFLSVKNKHWQHSFCIWWHMHWSQGASNCILCTNETHVHTGLLVHRMVTLNVACFWEFRVPRYVSEVWPRDCYGRSNLFKTAWRSPSNGLITWRVIRITSSQNTMVMSRDMLRENI